MRDPNALLGSILQGRVRGSAPMGRLEHALGEPGAGGSGGPLGQILDRLGLGSAAGAAPAGVGRPDAGLAGPGDPPAAGRPPVGGGAAPAGGGGLLDDLAGMAERYLRGGGAGGGAGGTLGGAGGGLLGGGAGRNLVLGGLAALAASVLARRAEGARGRAAGGAGGGLLGGLSPSMRGAVGAGGLALLALLAQRALRGAGPGPAMGLADLGGAGAAADVPASAVSPEAAALVLRAMIEAAKADGAIDAAERRKIAAKAGEDGAGPDDLAFLEQELARPADPEGLAAAAAGDPVVAAQVYAASLLAIEVDTPAERDHLRRLAGRLGLDPAVTARLHQALGAPAP